MYNPNSRKNKRILVLFLLVTTISLLTLSQIMWNTNNFLSSIKSYTEFEPLNRLKTADYSPSFGSTGENMNITLHQSLVNESTIEFTNLSNSNSFIEPFPNFNDYGTSLINVTLQDIYAPNYTLIIEDDSFESDTDLVALYVTSFTVNSSSYLINASFDVFTQSGSPVADVYLFNSSWSQGNSRNEPNSASSQIIGTFSSPPNGWNKISLTKTLLNKTKTDNNTWFIGLRESTGLAVLRWRYVTDATNGDNSLAYRVAGTILQSNDFESIVDLSPINLTAFPSEIGLKINNSKVEDLTQGSGYWYSTTRYSSSSDELSFILTSDWWDVACNVTKVQINYTKSDLKANSDFNIASSGQIVIWNVTRSGGLNFFDSRITNFNTINFTIPDTWLNTSIRVFNGESDERTSTITRRLLGNGYREINVPNAGNGTFWFLNATSTNLLSTIDSYIGLSSADTFNFTDIAHFNATFSKEISDGSINLSVYSPAIINDDLNYSIQTQSFTAGSNISLTDWDISDNVTQYGNFRVHVYWSNNTEAGFLEEIITIQGETSLTPSLPGFTFDASDVFDIDIFFNDTGLDDGISGASITHSLDGGATKSGFTDFGNGTYRISIDSNDPDFSAYGPNLIEINASKSYYNNQTETVEITILGETFLNGSIPKSSFNSTETFDISLFFNDTVKDLGISGATRNVYINQTLYTPISDIDYGNGNYDITINSSDDLFDSQGYGSFNLSVSIEKSYYYNKTADFIIEITGETNLTASKFPDPSKGYYNSDETFNITVYLEDIGRNEGINGGQVKVFVKEVFAGSYQEYSTTPYAFGIGFYNLTINCSNNLFNPYSKYDIKINATKASYYTANYTFEEELIIGNTTLTILSPTGIVYHDEGDIFEIVIDYEDNTLTTGIIGANVSYTLNGTGFRSDNVLDNVDGTYNITINTGDTDFGSNYGNLNIIIWANKSYYVNLTRTFTFERRILTQITPTNSPSLIEEIRGNSIFYTFNYSDKLGNPIDIYDTFQNSSALQNFGWNLVNDGGGNYTLEFNTSQVIVVATPYTLNFSIYAFGNQSQEISFTISITIIQTRIEIDSWNDYADFARSTNINISIDFYFNDTTNVEAIDGLSNGDIIVNDFDNGTPWSPGFELFNRVGNGNYTLNISTIGVISDFYTLELNISKSPNYNWSLTQIQFYLRGNYTQINMISVRDPEELLTPTGIGNNYTTFTGADLTIEFNVTDTEAGNKAITEAIPGFNIRIAYINIITTSTGTLQETFLFFFQTADYGTYIGDISSSELTEFGYYLVNITFAKLNYENTSFSFNLTLVDSQINTISISNSGGQLEPLGIGDFYNSTVTLDIIIEFNITDTESLDKTIARDATSYTVRYINLDTLANGIILNNFVYDSFASTYIGTITSSGLAVGNYLINVSVVILSYEIIPLTFNLTIIYAESNITSLTNPGGLLSLGIGNFYETFIGSNMGIEFNVTDTNFGTIIQIGAGLSYTINYTNMDTSESGIIFHSIAELASSHSGSLNISQFLTGNFTFFITVEKGGNNVTTLSFKLRITAKYNTRITVVNKPDEITAGDSFTIVLKVEYYDGSDWLVLVGTYVIITPYFDGIAASPTAPISTNSTGEVGFEITIRSDAKNMTLSVEIQEVYNYLGDTLEISDITVQAPPTGLKFEDLLPYLLIIGVAVAISGGSIGVYRGVVVPKKREKSRVLKEVKTIFDDAINLEHVLVLYKGTGTCVYFKSFGSDMIDPELISGFISAICSFGKDLVCQETLNEITYGDKMLLLSDGEYIRVTLVLSKKPSIILRKNLMEFINEFEKTYINELPNWRGQLNIFRESGILIDEILNTSIILPHEISFEFSNVKALKNTHSRDVLKVANNLMKTSDRKFFFIATLLKEATEKTNKDTAEIFMGIKELRDKKIMIPIEISAIEDQPISQQEMDLINQKVASLVNLSQEERQKLVEDLSRMGPAEREAYFVSLSEQEIVSAPIEEKPGAAVIDTIKIAKKEIKNLIKLAKTAKKEEDYEKTINILQNAVKIAVNWELLGESEDLEELIRLTKIEDLKKKMIKLEKEAKLAAKEEKYNEASQKYKISSKIASEIFKLGGDEMTKEVKRLTNKSKEYEKLI